MRNCVISASQATKVFKGNTALDHVSFELERGKIYGFVGRNGSGKTVLFKCICGFLSLTSGEIVVNGKIVGREIEISERIGVIIETPGFLLNQSGYHNLRFLASIRNRVRKDEIFDVMARVGLDPKSKKRVGKYSLGMRQRLGIAQAIMEDPDILILDEPMNGLDADGVLEMRRIFLGLKEQGKTILLASHYREDVEALCDVVYAMNKGVLTPLR